MLGWHKACLTSFEALIIFNKLNLFFLTFFTFAAGALQINSSISPANDLIQPVNLIYQRDGSGKLIEKDPRETLKNAGLKVGLSTQEVVQVQSDFVRISCQNIDEGYEEITTGTLVIGRDVVMVPAHTMYTRLGKFMQPCFYELLKPPFTREQLPPLTSANSVIFTQHPYQDRFHDVALLRLPKIISSAKPLALDETGDSIKAGQKLINIGGYQEDMAERSTTSDLIVQRCSFLKAFPPGYKRDAVGYSDCSSGDGGCGSVNLVRQDGQLKITSMQVGSGSGKRDRMPFDYETKSFSLSVGIGLFVADAARALTHDRN